MRIIRILSVLFVFAAFAMGVTNCGGDSPVPIQQHEADDKAETDDNNGKDETDEKQDTLCTHESLDLGLPSGTLWATCNIGASRPEEYGDYFTWGETTGYNSSRTDEYCFFSDSSFTLTKYCTDSDLGSFGIVDNKTELDLSDDAAYVNWGREWRIPSISQFSELIDSTYTITEMTTINGVYGCKISSKTNGNNIFFPAAGICTSSLEGEDLGGAYWSRTLETHYPIYAWYLNVYNGVQLTANVRYYGRSVRPVRMPQ